MTGRRAVPFLVGLWAASAAAQTQTAYATISVPIDAGTGFTRAYVITSDGGQYAAASAGADIRYFNAVTGGQIQIQPPPTGPFGAFAVADQVTAGNSVKSLVAAANVGTTCPTACLQVNFWDPVNGTTAYTSTSTNWPNPTAMAIDATSSPIRIFAATSSMIYEQDITIAVGGTISFASFDALPISVAGATVVGLTYDSNSGFLFLSDSKSNLYTVSNIAPLSAATFGIYNSTTTGGYSSVQGISYFSESTTPYLLGGGLGSGVYSFNPLAAASTNIVISNVQVAAVGGRITFPSAAVVNAQGNLTLVTEEPGGDAGFAFLHIVPSANLIWDGGVPFATPDGGPDAGSDAGTDGGTDAGPPDSGIPAIPIIPPGPGQLTGTVNSCNCSTAGSAPMLLALLLPLLLPRRRR